MKPPSNCGSADPPIRRLAAPPPDRFGPRTSLYNVMT